MALVAQSKSPPSSQALERILADIHAMGLERNLIELETQGFTTLKGVLPPATVARAKDAIVTRTERFTGRSGIDIANEDGSTLKGMTYIPYLLYDDPVFEEILLEPAPLALVTYLLGESCLLSSMGCHFRVPGGLPLMLHSDNGNGTPAPFSNTAFVANVNYALTPYSKEAGALAMVPGSHKLLRQPTLAENFRPIGKPGSFEDAQWIDPPNAIAMNIEPGDAVVWHGNTWHGGYRRELPGARINLAAYFCRQFVQTQESHGRAVPKDLLARHANDARFATLLGQRAPYGWGPEGPDYALMNKSPRGLYD